MILSHKFAAVVVVAYSLLFATAAVAQNPRVPPEKPQAQTAAPPATPQPPHPLTAQDAEAFLDGLIPMQIRRADVAGAVICIVKDGKVLFAKGYGYADVKSKKPVTVDTLFRPGSISKLFTWTAIMQLVEQGKINLDADVNQYLDFKIPPREGKPITIRNLMTHTPGFEEEVKDLIQTDPHDNQELGSYLKHHIPARIFAPGAVPAYSNYGAGLAGYIVQRVSGQPFDDYVEQHIFTPLQMTHSSFRQPLPDALKAAMSSGYKRASDDAKPYEMVNPAPAGALATSASDIAHFMLAHLQNGQYENAHILQPATAQLMHARQFGLVDSMNGMALGFYEESRNGYRIIGHGGDTLYFHSDLHLVPELNLGFYISFNSAGKDGVPPRGAIWQYFLDRYYPRPPKEITAIASAATDAKQVTGRYMTSRRFETNILRLASLSDTLTVTADKDGKLTADSFRGLNGKPKKWIEIAPMQYQSEDGESKIAFKSEPNGGTTLVADFPAIVYQRIPWYQTARAQIFMMVFVVGVLAIALLLWPVSALIRWHYQRPLPLVGATRASRTLVRVAALIELAVLIAWPAFLALTLDHMSLLSARSDPWVRTMQGFALLGCIGAVLTLIHVAVVWASSQLRLWQRVLETLIVLASVGYLWLIISWNVLHLSLNY